MGGCFRLLLREDSADAVAGVFCHGKGIAVHGEGEGLRTAPGFQLNRELISRYGVGALLLEVAVHGAFALSVKGPCDNPVLAEVGGPCPRRGILAAAGGKCQ